MLIDIHTHVLPDIDDGALNLDMSIDILKESVRQGTTVMFATSHSFAFLDGIDNVMPAYQNLLDIIKEEKIPIRLYLGCEILCMPHLMKKIILNLEEGKFPSMNGTKYVLIEFTIWNMDYPDVTSCIMQLLEAGWIPVLAHVERYVYSWTTIENILFYKSLGCLIQINAYSIVEETDAAIKSIAIDLLDTRLVDVIGTDTHGNHHRPPRMESGINYLKEHYDREYVEAITYKNAIKYFSLEEKV